uniref:Uncharacterized protein n=1 Tax=Neisseria meningitidis alpha275 TaxID=295996 RepID=C6SNM5_NEIME|nr:hypothetical protein predicted by Glimmer/Critica [Neisseria meningitidis alpha275]
MVSVKGRIRSPRPAASIIAFIYLSEYQSKNLNCRLKYSSAGRLHPQFLISSSLT